MTHQNILNFASLLGCFAHPKLRINSFFQKSSIMFSLLLLSLPSAYADDEVSTSLLHLLRSLARTVAVVKSSLHSSKSLTLSIHVFSCLLANFSDAIIVIS